MNPKSHLNPYCTGYCAIGYWGLVAPATVRQSIARVPNWLPYSRCQFATILFGYHPEKKKWQSKYWQPIDYHSAGYQFSGYHPEKNKWQPVEWQPIDYHSAGYLFIGYHLSSDTDSMVVKFNGMVAKLKFNLYVY